MKMILALLMLAGAAKAGDIRTVTPPGQRYNVKGSSITGTTGSFSGSITASSGTIGNNGSAGLKLDVKGNEAATVANSGTTSNAIFRVKSSNGVALDFGSIPSNGANYLQSTDWGNLATTYPLALNPNGGSVGIGTTAPDEVLHVVGGLNPRIKLGGTGGSPGYVLDGGTADAGLFNVGGAGDISLHTGDALTQRMTILTANGNVGIGTTSPATALDVNGNAQFGSGATKSTFTATGSLYIQSASSITLTGSAPTARLDTGTYQIVTTAFTAATTGSSTCPTGKTLIGGGLAITGTATTITQSYPADSTAWGCTTTISTNFNCYAICLSIK